jgi:hypothetical protein
VTILTKWLRWWQLYCWIYVRVPYNAVTGDHHQTTLSKLPVGLIISRRAGTFADDIVVQLLESGISCIW